MSSVFGDRQIDISGKEVTRLEQRHRLITGGDGVAVDEAYSTTVGDV